MKTGDDGRNERHKNDVGDEREICGFRATDWVGSGFWERVDSGWISK